MNFDQARAVINKSIKEYQTVVQPCFRSSRCVRGSHTGAERDQRGTGEAKGYPTMNWQRHKHAGFSGNGSACQTS